jgi:hypothetical protein
MLCRWQAHVSFAQVGNLVRYEAKTCTTLSVEFLLGARRIDRGTFKNRYRDRRILRFWRLVYLAAAETTCIYRHLHHRHKSVPSPAASLVGI